MTKREVICSQHSHCLSCPLSVRITGKDCMQLTQSESDKYIIGFHAINKLDEHLTNIIKSYTKSIKISISYDIIKYCYKADTYYEFDRRVYFLSLLIENKIIERMNSNEVKKNSNSQKH